MGMVGRDRNKLRLRNGNNHVRSGYNRVRNGNNERRNGSGESRNSNRQQRNGNDQRKTVDQERTNEIRRGNSNGIDHNNNNPAPSKQKDGVRGVLFRLGLLYSAVLAMYFIGAPIVHDYLAGNFYGTSKSIFTYIFSRAVARKIIERRL